MMANNVTLVIALADNVMSQHLLVFCIMFSTAVYIYLQKNMLYIHIYVCKKICCRLEHLPNPGFGRQTPHSGGFIRSWDIPDN